MSDINGFDGDNQQNPQENGGNAGQPNYGQPNYTQPNYSQPDYNQPNYTQPNYNQSGYDTFHYQPGNGYGYPRKSRLAAGLLGYFLGGFGAHNFYLGYTSRAVIQIVVTVITCGIGSIWGMIESLMIFNGSIAFDASGIPLDPSASEPKSRMAAGLLGIFLGGFGIHNFYMGYTSRAIIQIVVTFLTCGIGAIWGFIEGILILAGSISIDASGIPLNN